MNHTTRTAIAYALNLTLNWVLVGLAFFIPLFFLPITNDMFFVNKHLLLFGGVSISLILWAGTFITHKKASLTIHPLLLPLALLAIASFASVFVNKTSLSVAIMGKTGLLVSLFLYVFIASSRPSGISRWLTSALLASSAILALGLVLSFSGLLNILPLAAWMVNKTFTPAGTMSTLVVFFIGTIPLAASRLKLSPPLPPLQKLVSICLVIVLLAGTIIAGILIVPGREAGETGMPMNIGWQIAVETLKQRPFLGVGTGNYLSAYTRYRPITTNTSSVWNQRFQQAPNELLHTFTETGVLGLMALLFLIWKTHGVLQIRRPEEKAAKMKWVSGMSISCALLLVSLFFFPLNVVSVGELATLLSIIILELKTNADARNDVYDASLGIVALREGLVGVERIAQNPLSQLGDIVHGDRSAGILSWIVAIPFFAISGLGLFLVSRAWAAEITFKQALDAIRENNGTIAYNKLIETLNFNPLFDTYHRQYADINLRLANSLASQTKLSDQDRANVSQLVQQSIREAKIAAQLNPGDVRNWETLSVIYRAIITVADGARDWSVIAYSEAIRLDPFNPLLRLDLGGVYYNAKDWEHAIQAFQSAANVKPDYANAYYNLALAYEQDDRPKEAVRAMQATIQNLDANSPDYAGAQQKLDELSKKAQQTTKEEPTVTTNTGTDDMERLSAPNPLPTPLPGANRVKLSQEEAPPPTPTPTPIKDLAITPTPTPAQ